MTTDKDRISAAFKALRKLGYVARQNFMCCGSCAGAAIAEDVERKGGNPDTAKSVYYHQQCNDAFRSGRYCDGDLTRDLHGVLYLHWQGDAAEIIAALRAQGLKVEHDGSNVRCIEVHPQ
jgi:hypothetical protein